MCEAVSVVVDVIPDTVQLRSAVAAVIALFASRVVRKTMVTLPAMLDSMFAMGGTSFCDDSATWNVVEYVPGPGDGDGDVTVPLSSSQAAAPALKRRIVARMHKRFISCSLSGQNTWGEVWGTPRERAESSREICTYPP